MNAPLRPAGPAVRGTLAPPPDKSISHRAALLGAMSADARARHATTSTPADTNSTLAAVRALGARVERARRRAGDPRPRPARRARTGAAIDVGNAGTLMRLLPGWLAGQDGGRWTLDGDAIDPPPPGRPHRRAAAPRWARGSRRARSASRRSRSTARPLHGIEYELPVARAQVKSCVLLAGLLADGRRRPSSSPRRAATTPSGCSPRAGAGLRRDGDRDRRSRRPTSSSSTRSTSPATCRRPRSTSPPPCSCPARGSS